MTKKYAWRCESPTQWRLDAVWTVRLQGGQRWFAYRRNDACWAGFLAVEDAMREAETLREEDKNYGNTE